MEIFRVLQSSLQKVYENTFEPKKFLDSYIYARAVDRVSDAPYNKDTSFFINEKIKILISDGDLSVWKCVKSEEHLLYCEVYKTVQGITVILELGNWLFDL